MIKRLLSRPAAQSMMASLCMIITRKAKGPVRIIGHTDSRGSEEYNQDLSLRRAAATKRWLINQGGTNAKYQVEGRGEKEPIAANTLANGADNPAGRAKNRRVEILIQVEEG